MGRFLPAWLYLLGGRTSQRPWQLAGAEGCWDTGCGRQGLPLSCWVNSVESWPFAWPPEAPPFPALPLSPPPQLQFELPTILEQISHLSSFGRSFMEGPVAGPGQHTEDPQPEDWTGASLGLQQPCLIHVLRS